MLHEFVGRLHLEEEVDEDLEAGKVNVLKKEKAKCKNSSKVLMNLEERKLGQLASLAVVALLT
jgi:hypothetical protein